MIRKIYRLLFLLFVVAGSLRMSAQNASSDVALWIVDSELSQSSIVDDGDTIEFDFDESVGYGISFNHFWTNAFSTEVALQKYGAELSIGSDIGPTFTVGELDVTSFTAMAQWHFNRDGRFSPYTGGGAAHISGEFESDAGLGEPMESIDLESELTWTAAVGANVNLTDRIALVGEMKYIPWDVNEEDGAPEDAIEADPVTFSAGVRFRF